MRVHMPSITTLFLLLSITVCVWFAATNYNLHQLVQQIQEHSQSQHKQAQKQIGKLNKHVTELHGKAETVDNEYNSIYPKLEGLLTARKKEIASTKEELENTKNKLKEAQSNNDELKKEMKGVMEIINAEHKEQMVYAGQRFRSKKIIDISVIVAYDWVDSKSTTKSLSILYVMDYFNQFSAKHNKTVEVVYVHPSQTSSESSFVLTSNVVSEFKTISSNSLETMLNEGARGAKGKYLLFIPILPSKNAQLDIELFIDLPKMLASFTSGEVGMVGGISIHNENDTLLDAGIDFAYAAKDAVTPFARYIGAGLHYPKLVDTPPCVSKTGMMIDRELFESVGAFSGKYTQDIKISSLGQIMEDSDLCLRVLEKSRKILYIPENSIKTTHLPVSITKQQQESLIMKFDSNWATPVRKLVEAKKELIDFSLVWDLYCGCTGVNVEAINYLVAMESKLNVGAVAGDGCWCGGFPTYVQESLIRISTRAIGPKVDVWVSHKPPDKYPSFPYKGLVTVEQRPAWIIGRSMSETDTIKADWVEKSKKADEIWIPTEFHREVFSVSGVSSSKLQVIEESLDTTLYDPETTVPLPLDPLYGNSFKFLSVFKWEARKGWDVLLQAYFEEFVGGTDKVVLVLQTYLYGERNPRDRRRAEDKIRTYAQSLRVNHTLPPVLVLTDELPELKMPQLYKACDAFVLPTRGEGWGLPVMEAMSMAMPSIVTNWSGPTQFTTKDTAYLLPYESLETVPRNFEGGSGNEKWAKPSLGELKKQMRAIYSNPSEAKKVGKQARAHIKDHFDRDIIAEKMVGRLKEIQKTLK